MGSVFSKPKAPEPYKPTEAQQQLERTQLETAAGQKSELASARGKIQQRARGRRSLLTGAATGVDEEKKATLG